MALKGNQKKLDKNNNNRIDAQDFKILKAEKAKGRGMGLQDEKVKPGKVMKARVGKSIKKDPTKPVNPFQKKPSSKFIERRKKLQGVKSLAGKAGRIGIAIGALGAAGAGAAKLGQTIGRKMFGDPTKKEKKMGGGMMDRPKFNKGGGFDAGTPGKVRDILNKQVRSGSKLVDERLTKRDMDKLKKIGRPKLQKIVSSKKYNKGGGADTGTMGEAKSKLATGIDAFKRRLKKEKLQAPKRGPMNPAKAMGGGMMMKPMGYKSGTSVKVKCKLGRNKPTKMY